MNSKFTHLIKEETIRHGEKLVHQKEQCDDKEFYKQLGEVIKHYNQIILFEPTDAKTELCNVLRANHFFDKIRIGTKQTDKMTDNQQHAFVKNIFTI